MNGGKLVEPATLAKIFGDEVPAGPGGYMLAPAHSVDLQMDIERAMQRLADGIGHHAVAGNSGHVAAGLLVERG